MLGSRYIFTIITILNLSSLVSSSCVSSLHVHSLWTWSLLRSEDQQEAVFSFRVDFPFDGSSAFPHHDKMSLYCKISGRVRSVLCTISLSLSIDITVIVHMPHVASLGGPYHAHIIIYCTVWTDLWGLCSKTRTLRWLAYSKNSI